MIEKKRPLILAFAVPLLMFFLGIGANWVGGAIQFRISDAARAAEVNSRLNVVDKTLAVHAEELKKIDALSASQAVNRSLLEGQQKQLDKMDDKLDRLISHK